MCMNADEGARFSYVLCEVVCIFVTETQYSILTDRLVCYFIHVSGIQVSMSVESFQPQVFQIKSRLSRTYADQHKLF